MMRADGTREIGVRFLETVHKADIAGDIDAAISFERVVQFVIA